MAQITPFISDSTPNTEVSTKQASGVSSGEGLENLGQSAQRTSQYFIDSSTRLGLAKADTDLTENTTNNIETQMNAQKQSFDVTDPDAKNNFLANWRTQNDAIRSTIHNPKVLEYFDKKAADQETKYWNMALHNNAIIQGKETGQYYDDLINTKTQAVSLNPALLDDQIKDLADSFRAYHPGQNDKGVVEKAITDASKKLSVAAVKGRIYDPNENPSNVLADLKNGKYDTGDATDQLVESAQREARSRQKQVEANDRAADHAQKQAQVKSFQDLTNSISDGQSSFSQINKMADDGLIDENHRAIAEKRLQSLIDGTQKSDPAVKQKLFNDMRNLPDGDPNKPQDFADIAAKYGHGLSQKDLQQASAIFLSPKGADSDTKASMMHLSDLAAKTLIRPTEVPWGDRQGVANWSAAINDIHDTYQKNIQSGKVTQQEMLDPSNKAFLGNIIQKYQRSRSDIANDATQALHGPSTHAPGVTTSSPIGIDPKGPPVNVAPKQATEPAYTAQQKAAIDALSAKIGASLKAGQ